MNSKLKSKVLFQNCLPSKGLMSWISKCGVNLGTTFCYPDTFCYPCRYCLIALYFQLIGRTQDLFCFEPIVASLLTYNLALNFSKILSMGNKICGVTKCGVLRMSRIEMSRGRYILGPKYPGRKCPGKRKNRGANDSGSKHSSAKMTKDRNVLGTK